MPISPQIRANWVSTQKKFDFPVNAIGVKIDPNDTKTMEVWFAENIDEDGRLTNVDTSMTYRGVPVENKPAPDKPKKSEQVLTYRGVPIT